MRGFLVLVHVLVVVLPPAQVLTAVNGEPLHVYVAGSFDFRSK